MPLPRFVHSEELLFGSARFEDLIRSGDARGAVTLAERFLLVSVPSDPKRGSCSVEEIAKSNAGTPHLLAECAIGLARTGRWYSARRLARAIVYLQRKSHSSRPERI